MSRSLLAGRNVSNATQKAEFVQAVFDFVRNNINTEVRYGLGKGGRGALIDQSGTPFDQAELVVKLLRKSGVTASYGVGDVTIAAAQFGRLTGLVKQLNADDQSFTVSLRQACRLLADGGIPASFNGGSTPATCDSLSGDLSSVTLSHVWVKVGTTIYDPALKAYTLKAGIDLPQAMGCGTQSASTCGSGVKAAVAGTTGTENGIPYIEGYSVTAGPTQVFSLVQNLNNYIKTTNRAMASIDLVGGKQLDPQTGPIAATYSERLSWSGDIPDQYRTLYVTDSLINNLTNEHFSFFADEIAGRRLADAPMMLVDDLVVSSSNYTAAAARRTFAAIPCTLGCVTITVDHPYAFNSGQYGDEQQTFKLVDDPTYEQGVYRQFNSVTGVCCTPNPDALAKDYPEKSNLGSSSLVFVHGFGQASLDALKQATELYNVASVYPDYSCVTGSTTGVILTQCANESQALTAATVNPYRTLMDRLVDGVSNTVTTRHHDIGVVYTSHTPEIARISLQESLNVAAKTGDDADRRRGYNVQALTLSEIEGMISPQEDNAQFSYASMFFNSKALPLRGTNFTTANRVYLIPPDKMAAFLLTQADAYPDTNRLYPAGWTCGNTCWRKTQLQAIADQGYTTLIMSGGQSELFFKSTSSAETEKVYTIWEFMKGGAAVTDPFKASMKTTEVIDAASKARKQLSVSPATGDLTYQAEPDIVTGEGDFPYSLPFVRTFKTTFRERMKTFVVKSEPRGCGNSCSGNLSEMRSHKLLPAGADAQFHERLGGAWDHNFNISLTESSNPVKLLGDDYALDAAWIVGRLQVLRDLTGATDTNMDLATHVTLAAATMYMGASADLSLKLGNGSDSFHYFNGTYFSDQNPNATITSISGGYQYTTSNGEVINFDKSASRVRVDQAAGTVTLTGASKTKLPSTWTFPSGVVITFQYELMGYNPDDANLPCSYAFGYSCSPYELPGGYRLVSVSNNLGRSLTFTFNDTAGLNAYITTTVTDENGRSAVFSVSGCDNLRTDSSATRWYYYSPTCNVFNAQDANGHVTKYEYSLATSTTGVRNYRLLKIYSPAYPTNAFETLSYDDLGRVTQVTDRNGHSTIYYPGGVTGGELWKPSSILSPNLDRNYIVYNGKNSQIYTRTPMGRISNWTYDNDNRVVKTILPEGNGTENQYDVRGNLLATRAFSKTCALSATTCADDITTSSSYKEGPSVLTCVNVITCDKLGSETDAMGSVTNYSWNATTGLLTQVLAPADRFGVRPQTDLAYTTCSGVNFLTGKTEKMSSTTSVLTTYAYNSSNHCTLQQVVTDSGGLNLTTGVAFDAIGNLISVDGPLPGTADTTTYDWYPDRLIKSVISADPDGSGSMLRKMVQYTYNSDGWVTQTDTGTATSATGAGFTVLTRELPSYDLMGNRTQLKVVKP